MLLQHLYKASPKKRERAPLTHLVSQVSGGTPPPE